MQASDIIVVPANWIAGNAVGILSAIAVLVVGWLLSRIAGRTIKSLLPRAYGVDRNFAPLLAQVARYGIIIFAIMTAASFLGVPNTSIIAILGAMGLAVALALQNTLSNIAAGIMLIWQRPISIGEYIVGDGVEGVVVEIGLFGTRLRSASGLYVFTPNLKLWNGAITNHSREPRRRIQINFTVPETVNLAEFRRELLDVAAADRTVLSDPPATVHVDSFAGDKIVLQLRVWVSTPDYLGTLRSLTETAKIALNRKLMRGPEGGRAEAAVVADPHSAEESEDHGDEAVKDAVRPGS
jgi:small conductance mechanosensitive channel